MIVATGLEADDDKRRLEGDGGRGSRRPQRWWHARGGTRGVEWISGEQIFFPLPTHSAKMMEQWEIEQRALEH